MYEYYFERLDVWKNARVFASHIYKMTSVFPESEKFGITNQLRRATLSIGANIAEGMSRSTDKDKARFLNMAYGSSMEVLSFLSIATDLEFITKKEYLELREELENITMLQNGLSKKLKE